MVDFILNMLWKFIKAIVVLIALIGIFNFLRVPGDINEKIAIAYEKTACQGAMIAHMGRDIFLSESDDMVQALGGGVSKLKEKKEKSIELSIASPGN